MNQAFTYIAIYVSASTMSDYEDEQKKKGTLV